ncbi:MAG: hypothetical protein ACP5KN_10535 [Armatimonadota bacterium]
MVGHMMGGIGTGLLMLLWWLIGLGVLFFVIYEAVYLAVRRALTEAGTPAPAQQQRSAAQPQPPSESQE